MNTYEIFTSLYCHMGPKRFIPSRIMSVFRVMYRRIADLVLSNTLRHIKPQYTQERDDIIVSLTSFPARINNVWKVISCLKLQEIKPGKIILWLSKDQFPDAKSIPFNLRSLQDDLFEIRMVEGDLRSHKKYYYVMKEFPESTVITVDDDLYYHKKTLTFLVNTAKKFPGAIIANLANQIKYKNQELIPSNYWGGYVKPFEGCNMVQMGAGGVLYPPKCLDNTLFDVNILQKCAPLADDYWLNVNARLAKTPVIISDSNIVFLLIPMRAPSLYKSNVDNGGNDVQIRNIREYFKKERGLDPYAFDYVVKY